MYMMKAHVMPQLYWHGLVKGWWEGPALFRKLFRYIFQLYWSRAAEMTCSLQEAIQVQFLVVLVSSGQWLVGGPCPLQEAIQAQFLVLLAWSSQGLVGGFCPLQEDIQIQFLVLLVWPSQEISVKVQTKYINNIEPQSVNYVHCTCQSFFSANDQ